MKGITCLNRYVKVFHMKNVNVYIQQKLLIWKEKSTVFSLVTSICVNIDSGNGLPQPILTYQWCLLIITSGKFHKRYLGHQLSKFHSNLPRSKEFNPTGSIQCIQLLLTVQITWIRTCPTKIISYLPEKVWETMMHKTKISITISHFILWYEWYVTFTVNVVHVHATTCMRNHVNNPLNPKFNSFILPWFIFNNLRAISMV